MRDRPGAGVPFYEERYRRLEALGLTELNDWIGPPPIQIEGLILPENAWFYFRARSGGASLSVYPSKDAFHSPAAADWEGEVEYDEDAVLASPEWELPHELVEALVRHLLATWRARF